MKVHDIVSEAPVGAVDRAKQAVGGVVSKGQRRKGEVSKEANKVAKELKSRLQGAGVDLKKIPVDTFLNVLNQTGYGQGAEQQVNRFVDKNDSDATLSKKQAEQIILKQTQSASLSPQGSGIKKGKFAGGSDTRQKKKTKSLRSEFKSGFERGSTLNKQKTGNTKTNSKQEKINQYVEKINQLEPSQRKQIIAKIKEFAKQ